MASTELVNPGRHRRSIANGGLPQFGNETGLFQFAENALDLNERLPHGIFTHSPASFRTAQVWVATNTPPPKSEADKASAEIGKVLIEADDPDQCSSFVYEALEKLGMIPSREGIWLTYTRVTEPPGLEPDAPVWANNHMKVWEVIERSDS